MFAPVPTRRFLSLAAALACITALLLGIATPSPGAASPRPYTVRAGDTLWSIATAHYPGRDVREAVYRIEQANDLAAGPITPGQTIGLP